MLFRLHTIQLHKVVPY